MTTSSKTNMGKIKEEFVKRFGEDLDLAFAPIFANKTYSESLWQFIKQVYIQAQQNKVEEIEGWATQNIKSGKDYDKLYEFLHQPKENKKG
jgi:ribosomal protein S17E